MKGLLIGNGVFIFENQRERCKNVERIGNTIEMSNVTIFNTENVALNVNGCVNVSIEKFVCSNVTWKKPELFKFRGSLLNINNIQIQNILTGNNNIKHNKFIGKSLFLIYESVAEIQNTCIRDGIGMSTVRPDKFSTVIIVQNSVLRIINFEMVRNFFRNFLQAEKSSLSVINMTLSENCFTGALCSGQESIMKLHQTKFYSNKIECLVHMNLNSTVLITNNSLIGNKILKNAYSIKRSHMKLNVQCFVVTG